MQTITKMWKPVIKGSRQRLQGAMIMTICDAADAFAMYKRAVTRVKLSLVWESYSTFQGSFLPKAYLPNENFSDVGR